MGAHHRAVRTHSPKRWHVAPDEPAQLWSSRATRRSYGCATFIVALVTRAIREIDTDVELGPEDGIPVACAVSLVNQPTSPCPRRS